MAHRPVRSFSERKKALILDLVIAALALALVLVFVLDRAGRKSHAGDRHHDT